MKKVRLDLTKSFCLFKTYENLSSPKEIATLHEWYDFIIGNNIKNLQNNEEDFIKEELFNNSGKKVILEDVIKMMNRDEYRIVIEKLNKIEVADFIIAFRNFEGEISKVYEDCLGFDLNLDEQTMTITFDKNPPLTVPLNQVEYVGMCYLEFVDMREEFANEASN